MWISSMSSLTLILLGTCSSTLAQSSTPTPVPIPITPAPSWAEKVDILRDYLLTQPISTINNGFWNGPYYQVNFTDGDCHQIRLYNWECTYSVPYKLRYIADWMDRQGFRDMNRTRFPEDSYRWYSLGYYRDPDDGWGFYDVARFSYGQCGNRGSQSACGHRFCTYRNGTTFPTGPPPYHIPEGMSPYQDPNDKDMVCPWFRDDYNNGTVSD